MPRRISRSGVNLHTVGYGVTANIAAFHAAARGSIPRIRVFFVQIGCRLPFGSFWPGIDNLWMHETYSLRHRHNVNLQQTKREFVSIRLIKNEPTRVRSVQSIASCAADVSFWPRCFSLSWPGEFYWETLKDLSKECALNALPYRCLTVGYGVTANIAASHAAARGSTPRIRVLFASCRRF